MKSIKQKRERKILRVRKKISGTSAFPRLCVSKTNKHIYTQLIDDVDGKTIFSASTLSNKVKETNEGSPLKKGKESAKVIGVMIGDFIASNKIEKVSFDRRWAKFHGILASVVEGIKEKADIL